MVDGTSTMADEIVALPDRIAARVREQRLARGLSLEALAARSGVSRSMISLVERGEASPTAVVLEKLAVGLDVTLGSLFDDGAAAAASPVARRDEQPLWVDPASGYERRNVSPATTPDGLRLVEVSFPAGARVAFDTGPREPRVHQLVWLLEGSMTVAVGGERHVLQEGDCLAMHLDEPVMFHNPTAASARYAIVVAPEQGGRR
jgi:transcriptional regulator with XRE-family HTH domain